jgi:hypothetical protein
MRLMTNLIILSINMISLAGLNSISTIDGFNLQMNGEKYSDVTI